MRIILTRKFPSIKMITKATTKLSTPLCLLFFSPNHEYNVEIHKAHIQALQKFAEACRTAPELDWYAYQRDTTLHS